MRECEERLREVRPKLLLLPRVGAGGVLLTASCDGDRRPSNSRNMKRRPGAGVELPDRNIICGHLAAASPVRGIAGS